MNSSSRGTRSPMTFAGRPEVAAVDFQVLTHRDIGVEIALLRHQADLGLHGPGHGADRGVEDLERAPRHRRQPHDHAHGRGLASTVGPEQADAVRLLDLEADALDRLKAAEALDQVPRGDDRCPLHGRYLTPMRPGIKPGRWRPPQSWSAILGKPLQYDPQPPSHTAILMVMLGGTGWSATSIGSLPTMLGVTTVAIKIRRS